MSKKTRMNSSESLQEIEKQPSQLNDWETRGIVCQYAKFIHPVASGPNREPVSEFKTSKMTGKYTTDPRYLVDSLVYTPYGLIWRAHGEVNLAPIANINHVRPSSEEKNL